MASARSAIGSGCLLVSIVLLGGIALLGRQDSAVAGDSQGAQLAATCASCHDMNGSDTGIPSIVGRDEQAIIDAVLAYRLSETPSHVMHAVALSLTDGELISVARYLATLEVNASSP
jgi:cytochrome c553